jgi:hypothetical protein
VLVAPAWAAACNFRVFKTLIEQWLYYRESSLSWRVHIFKSFWVPIYCKSISKSITAGGGPETWNSNQVHDVNLWCNLLGQNKLGLNWSLIFRQRNWILATGAFSSVVHVPEAFSYVSNSEVIDIELIVLPGTDTSLQHPAWPVAAIYQTILSFIVHASSYMLGVWGLVDWHTKVWPPMLRSFWGVTWLCLALPWWTMLSFA